MNIEERKNKFLNDVALLEKDIETLQKNICEMKKILPEITTEEDAEKFDSTFDIEKGLKYIALF